MSEGAGERCTCVPGHTWRDRYCPMHGAGERPDAIPDWRTAAEEVIARFTSMTLLPSQRQALVALGDALRAAHPEADRAPEDER